MMNWILMGCNLHGPPVKGLFYRCNNIFYNLKNCKKKKILQPQMGMNGADNMKEWGIADMGGQHHQAGRRKSTKWIIITLTLHPIRPYRTLIHNIHLPRSPLPTRPSSLFRIRSQPPRINTNPSDEEVKSFSSLIFMWFCHDIMIKHNII